jgi:hypothetical protein
MTVNEWQMTRRDALRLGVGFAAASLFTRKVFADTPAATRVVRTTNGVNSGRVPGARFARTSYCAPRRNQRTG